MSDVARKFLLGLLLLLLGGAAIGALYGNVAIGLLVATLLALLWQVRQLLNFERALKTGNFDEFRYGEGIWEQFFSRFRFEKARADRRKSSYRRLLREIRKSTDAMPDGAIVLDASNEIVSCNRAAKNLAGIKRRKDRGQRIENILRAPNLNELINNDDYANAAEIPSPVVDGDWLHCRIVPYGAEQKLLLLRDVTEQKKISKMRRDFVANASHELRSPLTVISGYLDALSDDQVPPAWSKPLRQMRTQAERMNQIVTELLELSRLESAGTASAQESIDMAALLDSVKRNLSGPATAATIVIKIESPALLHGNRSEIESVVVNLLSNALRHTPAHGEIEIIWRSSPAGGELIVSDNGEGIDADHLARVTERFFRVDRGRSRDGGGVGLGLAIVKHVLLRHDAELTIKSERDAGSEFRCEFPAFRVTTPPPATLS